MMAMRRIKASSLPEFPKVRAEDHSGADGDNADEAELAALTAIGAVVYGGMVLALFGRDWLARFRGTRG